MFRNYLKTTWRNLWKNKTYSFLNIFGLAIGIACAGFIFLWVEDEMTFDHMFPKRDRLYKILVNWTFEGKARTFFGASTPGPLAAAIKEEIPGVANTCRVSERGPLFSLGDKSIYENGCYADASLFNMFDLQFVQGNAKDAFKERNTVVITEKMARRFFGDEKNVTGKMLQVDHGEHFMVTGVVKDMPANSSIQFSWIMPFELLASNEEWMKSWDAYWTDTYVELLPTANVAAANRQLHDFIQKRITGTAAVPFLFNMNDWRLYSGFEDGKQVGGRITYVRLFSIIAWIILLIACINFMNLATARSEQRAREVGVRKVMGAGRKVLTLQFIGEALCMSALAVALGVLIITLLLPAFNALVDKQLTIGLLQPLHLLALLAITLLCGLVAGSYPALYLSSFHPVAVLKGLKMRAGSAALIRKGLVVFQFTASIVLIISTVIIYQQIQYAKQRNLGYNKDNLVRTELQGDMLKHFPAIKQDLLNTGVVANAALSSNGMLYTSDNTSDVSWRGKDPLRKILVSRRSVSPEFIATWGMKIAAGRDFVPEVGVDSAKVLITESMAKAMGMKDVLGEIIRFDTTGYQVVGVVKDYVYGDVYGKSDPVVFFNDAASTSKLFIRIKPQADPVAALEKIGAVIQQDNPGYPFISSFVDDQFNALFQGEVLVGRLSNVFAVLAVIISCLGLFGLAAYTAERRTREIGIRKVLGASVAGIAGLLSKDFLQLVIISSLIAFPVAWWAMSNWLQGFSYRVPISYWVFAAAGIAALVIALATISFQAVKAALADPAKSLRTE